MKKESRAGKISDLNTRYSLTISKELKEKYSLLATKENRSLNNMFNIALQKFLEDKEVDI